MSHTSPASFLIWAILSCLLGCFLVYHLWSFDRFKCLRWDSGPQSGAFKRVMTYSYLITVPLIMTFSIGFTIIKYHEGYISIPPLHERIVPKPYKMWGDVPQSAAFPLLLMFSVGWSLEMVTHLEELCFWLFLVNAGSAQQDWFRSLYFRTWVIGSICAVVYMPLVTIFTHDDPLKSEASTFLAGSLGSLSLTLWFLPVLWSFPSFLANLKAEGVEIATIIRLTKFHELNSIRVIFRFLFTVPLVILGADGLRPHTHVNETQWATDLLAMISAIGVAISSAITLVIFFPRSVQGEMAAKERRKGSLLTSSQQNGDQQSIRGSMHDAPGTGTYLLTSSPVKEASSLPLSPNRFSVGSQLTAPSMYEDERQEGMLEIPFRPLNMRPNRLVGSHVEMGTLGYNSYHISSNLSRVESGRTARLSTINPMVHGFTSPINLASTTKSNLQFPNNGSRLTFTRR